MCILCVVCDPLYLCCSCRFPLHTLPEEGSRVQSEIKQRIHALATASCTRFCAVTHLCADSTNSWSRFLELPFLELPFKAQNPEGGHTQSSLGGQMERQIEASSLSLTREGRVKGNVQKEMTEKSRECDRGRHAPRPPTEAQAHRLGIQCEPDKIHVPFWATIQPPELARAFSVTCTSRLDQNQAHTLACECMPNKQCITDQHAYNGETLSSSLSLTLLSP